MMYKVTNGMVPPYINAMFKNNTPSNYQFRNQKTFSLPNVRTNLYRKSFVYTGSKLWDSLSEPLKSASSLASFKRLIKSVDLCSERHNK